MDSESWHAVVRCLGNEPAACAASSSANADRINNECIDAGSCAAGRPDAASLDADRLDATSLNVDRINADCLDARSLDAGCLDADCLDAAAA